MIVDKPEDRAFLMSAMNAVAAAARTEGIEFQRWSVLDQAEQQMGKHAPLALRDAVTSANLACSRSRLRRIGISCFFLEALEGQPTPAGKIPLGAEAEMSRLVRARQSVLEQCEADLRRETAMSLTAMGNDQWSRVVAAVAAFADGDALDRAAKPLLERDALLTAEEAVGIVTRSWEDKAHASLHPVLNSAVTQERAEFAARMQEALRKIVT